MHMRALLFSLQLLIVLLCRYESSATDDLQISCAIPYHPFCGTSKLLSVEEGNHLLITCTYTANATTLSNPIWKKDGITLSSEICKGKMNTSCSVGQQFLVTTTTKSVQGHYWCETAGGRSRSSILLVDIGTSPVASQIPAVIKPTDSAATTNPGVTVTGVTATVETTETTLNSVHTTTATVVTSYRPQHHHTTTSSPYSSSSTYSDKGNDADNDVVIIIAAVVISSLLVMVAVIIVLKLRCSRAGRAPAPAPEVKSNSSSSSVELLKVVKDLKESNERGHEETRITISQHGAYLGGQNEELLRRLDDNTIPNQPGGN